MTALIRTARRSADALAIRFGRRFSKVARLRVARRVRRLSNSSEPELRLVSLLVPGRTFVDVGANAGIYAIQAFRHNATEVVAVEPVPELAGTLRHLLGSKARVVEAAASDVAGRSTLTIPSIGDDLRTTRSTLEGGLSGGVQVSVETVRLDQLAISGPVVIKIDVEGHELAALAGATGLLEDGVVKAILVECEERHNRGAAKALTDFLGGFGYEGWLVVGDSLVPAADFDPAVHQSGADVARIEAGEPSPATYGNNFIFVPTADGTWFAEDASRVGFYRRAD